MGCCSRQLPQALLGDTWPGCPAAEGAGAGAAVTDGAVAAVPAQLLTMAAVSCCSSIDFFATCLRWSKWLGQIHHSPKPRQSELSRRHRSPFPWQEPLQTIPPEHTLAYPLQGVLLPSWWLWSGSVHGSTCSSPSLSISLWNQSCCHCVSPSGSIAGRGSPCVPTLKPCLPTLPLLYPDNMFLFCSASSAPVLHRHLVFPQPHSPSHIRSCSPEPSSPTHVPLAAFSHVPSILS